MTKNKTNQQYDKLSMVGALAQYEEQLATFNSQRSAANELGIPRSTIRHWFDQKNKIPLPKEVVNFLESEYGFEFLHRLQVAIQFVMTQVGSCGIRQVCLVMELSKLDYFIASSYESVRQRSIKMENYIGQFGDDESKLLAIGMPAKNITAAQDETFHPEICLVAMDPVSNYILLEKYAKNLSSSTWSDAMTKALEGLNVIIIQSTADQGSALIKYISETLCAHHSADLFHVKYDIYKGISGTLGRNLSHATKAVLKIESDIDKNANKEKPDEAKAKELKKSLKSSKKNLSIRHTQSKEVKKASNAIGAAYHPYDIHSGEIQTEEKLEATLNQSYTDIESVADATELKETGKDKIQKSKKLITSLVGTMSFYFTTIGALILSLGLNNDLDQIMREILIPIAYLRQAEKKAKGAENRAHIRSLIYDLESKLEKNKTWIDQTEVYQRKLRVEALNCANVFQRSSSCVEGRNGYLSLRHHGLHKISDRKLKVLTVIHNYFIKRDDDTTAAERFFEQKHRDLFEELLGSMPYAKRSRKKLPTVMEAA
jgi:hypothetical protein